MLKLGTKVQSYIVTVAVTILALLLMLGLDPWLATSQNPFLLFFGAVAIAALYGGTKPGIVATLLSALFANYFFFAPKREITLDLAQNARMLLFILQGFFVSYLCGALRTSQKKAQLRLQQLQTSEKALQESEERYRQLAENLVETVFWIAEPKQARLIYVSPAYEKIWGRSCASWYANFMAWSEAIHPDDRERVETVFCEQALKGGYDREYRIVRPDGSLRWIRDRGFAIKNESGEPYRVVGLAEDISDRKRVEEALKKSEERFRVSQELSLDAFTILRSIRDNSGKIVDFEWTYANPKAAEILKHPAEQLVGRRLLEVLPGNKINSELFARYVRVVETQESHDIEFFYDAEGITGWFRNMCVKLNDGVAIFFSDISDRKRYEENLRNSEAIASSRVRELETFMETVPVGVWISRDRQCHEMIANRTAYEIIRVPPGEIATATPADGQNPFKFKQRTHGRDLPLSELPMQRAARTGQAAEEELELIFDDGEVKYLYGKAVPLLNEFGEVRGAIGAFLDVSDRKQIQEALRRREEELRLVTDRVPVLISFVDAQQRYRFNNLTYEKWFGRSAAEVYGKHLQEVLGDAYETICPYIEQALAGQQVTFESQVSYQNTGTRYIEATYVPQFDERGNVEGFVSLVSDISDRKKAELRLLQQAKELRQLNVQMSQTTELLAKRNQELDRFVYIVSHDLKAPLRAIANLSQWIEEDLEEQLPEENQQQMQLLRSRVHRMEALIDGLLAYARIGRTKVAEEMVNVKELLAEILDSLAPPDTFTIIVKPPMPSFVTKRLLLSQVFSNLISNAIKHQHKSDGQIIISATKKENCYEFTVTDDGPGIAREYHEKIFGIFQTLTADKTKDSTGIGLSIVRKIIETEGGKITVESELGVGTTFRFTWRDRDR
jgi:PAS domain S-box-containing protein